MDLYNDDCFDIFNNLADHSVDFILMDPPYGVLNYKWDKVLGFENTWRHLNRICKKDRAICVFGTEPFSSKLRISNLKNYRYDWIWIKGLSSNFCNYKFSPRKTNEIISVFSQVKHLYLPQMVPRDSVDFRSSHGRTNSKINNGVSKGMVRLDSRDSNMKFPENLLYFKSLGTTNKNRIHPSQKPVELLEYLIKTYTNEGDTVLDPCMGSGSTGIACKNLNRKFIGIERDIDYFNKAKIWLLSDER